MKKNKHLLIAIIGPDGCGKTSVSTSLSKFFKKNDFNVVEKASNFEILPTFSEIKWKISNIFNTENSSFVRNVDSYKGLLSGMKQKPNSFLKSFLIIGWYTVDYILGYFILFRKKKNKTVFLFSRYFYDYYFQISNRNFPHMLLDLFGFFVPQPDIVFYLERPAVDIYNGKPELSVLEIIRQQEQIKHLSSNRTNFF